MNNYSQFSYDGFGQNRKIVETVSGSVTSTKQFILCFGRRCESRDASSAVVSRYFTRGQTISGTSYFITKDHLTSSRELTDSGANVQGQYAYSPYGTMSKVAGALDAEHLYADYYFHQRSSLNLAKLRPYSTATGRWITRDPIEEADFINLFTYCENNPELMVDPSGLYCCRIDWDDVKKAANAGSAWGAGAGALGGALAGAGAGTMVMPGGGTVAGWQGGAALGAMGLGAVGGFAAGGANLAGQLINASGSRPGSGSDLPSTGPPNGSLVKDEGGGKGTIRDYDGTGKAKTDYDFGHDHGAGDPHAHDWDWCKPKNKRGPGRPLKPGE